MPLSPQAVTDRVIAFREGLKEAGRPEGPDLSLEFRWAQGRYDRLPELARELVDRRVDLILAGTSAAALAAKAATATIPIVFTAVGGDPVRLGLVSSFNRPGGNITGISTISTTLIPKRLELLRELVPTATTIAVLLNPSNPNSDRTTREMASVAELLGRKLVIAFVATDLDFDAAFAKITSERAGALLVDSDAFFLAQRYRISVLAARHVLPAVYELRDYAAAGGLMSYGPNNNDAYRQAAVYVARILRGEKPADLPIMQPTRFELVINLQAAKSLGIDVPPTLLATADEVIE
jgi:putative ABC transport system substrate-binding protein